MRYPVQSEFFTILYFYYTRQFVLMLFWWAELQCCCCCLSYYRFDKVKRWLICWGVHIALFFKDFVWWYFCTKSFYGLRNNLVWHKYSLKFVKSKTSYVKSYFWYPNNPSSILLLEFMLNIIEIPVSYGPSTKYVRICLAIFDTPLPNVGILTLSWLTPTF